MQTMLFIELNELMIKYRFKPRKKFAQHFIIDEQLIERIVKKASLSKRDIVLEIGAGTGFLTRALLAEAKVIAVEKDRKLCEILEEIFAKEISSGKMQLICKDFIKLDLEKLNFNKVVSFPPYYISSKILFKLLPMRKDLMLFVFQKEFVEKLIALPGFHNYNALTVITDYFSNVKILEDVPKSSFFPKPKAESQLIKIEPKLQNEKAKDEETFVQFTKAMFRHPNKNLRNSLAFAKKIFAKSNVNKKLDLGNADRYLNKKILNEKVNLIPPKKWVEIFNKLAINY
ncbi:MAG: ribosomal RNA small subunit methyltransferase A [Candidatus Diapherotrites archaeon]|nr:ribosomal RNA small subunit methyltransferase A [Candidatus Diapherotrites archaeon]